MDSPCLLVIQHNLDDPLDQLARPLTEKGLAIETWFTQTHPQPPRPLEAYDGVLTLGAQFSVNDETKHRWIATERSLLTGAVESGTPTLGICFGAQLLARVAGAEVEPAQAPEIGWLRVSMSEEAFADPVLGVLGPEPHVFQWHYESFWTPNAGVIFGYSEQANQAIRVGERAWGVQFHIEVGPSTLNSWLGIYRQEFERYGINPDALSEETRLRWRTHARLTDDLGRAFADQVRRFA